MLRSNGVLDESFIREAFLQKRCEPVEATNETGLWMLLATMIRSSHTGAAVVRGGAASPHFLD